MLIKPLFPIAYRIIKFKLFILKFLAVYKLYLHSFIHSITILLITDYMPGNLLDAGDRERNRIKHYTQ